MKKARKQVEDGFVPVSGVSIMDLQRSSCRYPLPRTPKQPQFFCGETIERGSYCETHAFLCYLSDDDGSEEQEEPAGRLSDIGDD